MNLMMMYSLQKLHYPYCFTGKCGFSCILEINLRMFQKMRCFILEAFPHLKCTVLDLPHVAADMPKSENLSYVGGDMFQSIPHVAADAILLKHVLHSWRDEDCVKLLKKRREAIAFTWC